ncbi:class I SAM-dependent methyltransferase [Cohnella endophytica]|uniref:Class I SAM-dependent methyltransferase n=1 Tax=Cohnella endophytica TaxID=2419778 RepID=A0A494XBR5_9BACL|nr:class I SAM-dependent methyltransferase [Cohnella endophytica]RKP48010.1 class I SAM-dependent methyltransferase [Cohnella endophytica]
MNGKQRFSSRVEKYTKYRPSYPKEAIDYLYDEVGLSDRSNVLDIGAGTGIFSRLLLEKGTSVTAVEPNAEMRAAAESASEGDTNFRAIAGSAEETGLPEHSFDAIVCAQAFHWFDRSAAQTEFRRVLKPGGKAILVWNTRVLEGTPFLEGYESLLHRLGTDYGEVNHRNISREMLEDFFRPGALREARFFIRQLFDFDGLSGRLLSSSYSPEPGHPNYEPMMKELRELFDRNEQDGTVSFDYVTEVYWGEV